MGFSDMYTLNSITESHLFMNSDSPIRSPTSKLCMNLGVCLFFTMRTTWRIIQCYQSTLLLLLLKA